MTRKTLLATNNYNDFNIEDYDIMEFAQEEYSDECNSYSIVKDYLEDARDENLDINAYFDYLGIDLSGEFEEWAESNFYANWDSDIYNLIYQFKNCSFLVYATLDLWDGKRKCEPTFIYDFEDVIMKCCEDYNRIYVDDNGELIVEAAHHDGTNYFTVRSSEDKPLGMRTLKAMGMFPSNK